MGLLSKHKGAAHKCEAQVHVHVLSPWPLRHGTVAVALDRNGKKIGQTSAQGPTHSAGSRFAVYVFEEAVTIPCTLFEDATAAKRGMLAYERKELQLHVVQVDGKGKAQGSPLGTVTINLADYMGAASPRQQSLPLTCGRDISSAVGTPKLLVTVVCQEAGQKGGLPAVPRLTSSSQEEEAAAVAAAAAVASASADAELITSLSTDEEGSSRASSRRRERPEGRLGAEAQLPALREHPADSPQAASAAAAAAAGAGAAGSERVKAAHYDSDGFLTDDSLQEDASEAVPEAGSATELGVAAAPSGLSQGLSSSFVTTAVRRNLGSVLLQADSTEGGVAGGSSLREGAAASEEVQSRSPPAVTEGLHRANNPATADAGADQAAAEATPAAGATEAPSPEPWGTDQSSISAGLDPGVPFTVQPSTQRRFVRQEGGPPGRRWAWRKDVATLPAGAPGSQFQRARLASSGASGRMEEAAAAAALAAEASDGASAAAEAAPVRSGLADVAEATKAEGSAAAQGSEVSLPASNDRTSVELEHPHSSQAVAFPAKASAGSSMFAALQQEQQPAAMPVRPASAEGSRLGHLSFGPNPSALLLPAASMLSFASSADGAAAGPAADAKPLLDALARELRAAAALEAAVYLAAGQQSFADDPPSSRQLHAPARRLARTTISLGGQEGVAFGLRAVRAVQAVCGAASGDLHRMAFWWGNVQQLRWMLWACCQSEATLAAAATQAAPGQEAAAGGGHAASPAALSTSYPEPTPLASGAREFESIMRSLVPPLRELEAWLFDAMLHHLWWHVLLPAAADMAAASCSRPTSRSSSQNAEDSPGGKGLGDLLGNGRLRPRGSSQQEQPLSSAPSSLQGTPRQYETAEEAAVQCWVDALGATAVVLSDPSRPAPATRTQLLSLQRQLLVALLRRLDSLLFHKLLTAGGPELSNPRPSPGRQRSVSSEASTQQGPSPGSRVLTRLGSIGGRRHHVPERAEGVPGMPEHAAVELDPALLPFQRGRLTFGTGVALKMAVSRFTHWAADVGVKEDRLPAAGRSTEALADYRLFPSLRASADLLMMPKQVLADKEIRREVVPGLPLPRICQLLERFEPDESAPEPLPEGLLEDLAQQSPSGAGARGAASSGRSNGTKGEGEAEEAEYHLPSEGELLAQGMIEPVSLQMDAESDAELEDHEQLQAAAAEQAGGEPSMHRFALLRELWTSA